MEELRINDQTQRKKAIKRRNTRQREDSHGSKYSKIMKPSTNCNLLN